MYYKYTDREGALKILSNRNLLFKRPSELNDPFEVLIDDLFGIDLEEAHEESARSIFELLLKDPKLYAERMRLPLEDAINAKALLNKFNNNQKEAIIQFAREIGKNDPGTQKVQKFLEDSIPAIQELFSNCGIFCVTKNKNSMLMWSHYAQQHYGAIIGFKPSQENDSFLKMIKPVVYTDTRPVLLQDTKTWLTKPKTSQEHAEEAFNKLIYTKSKDWEYEDEYRLAIPYTHGLLSFPASDCVEIIFGCKMLESEKNELIEIAKKLNPNIKFYSASIMKRTYTLEYTLIN